jgi:hypothetical protein
MGHERQRGDKDPTVLLGQSQFLDQALTTIGVEHTLRIIQDGTHGGKLFQTPEIQELVSGFLDQHLQEAKKSP